MAHDKHSCGGFYSYYVQQINTYLFKSSLLGFLYFEVEQISKQYCKGCSEILKIKPDKTKEVSPVGTQKDQQIVNSSKEKHLRLTKKALNLGSEDDL